MIAYARRIGWIIFWVAVVILGLLIVPVMHNTSAIPTLIFAIIVLAIFSGLWGTGMLGRRLAMSGAAIVLVVSTLSFYLPLTAKRVPEKVRALDIWLTSTPTPTPAPVAYNPPPTRDALVLMDECITPCGRFVGYGYKWIADGPAKVLYHNSKKWVGEGSPTGKAEDPTDFEPGMAQFESLEGQNVHTLAHIYKKGKV